jgi:hypothetical protein
MTKPPLGGKPPFATPMKDRAGAKAEDSTHRDFLRQDRSRLSKLDTSLSRSRQNAAEISVGDWKAHLNDTKLSSEEQFARIKHTAKAIEDKALRQMFRLHGTLVVGMKSGRESLRSTPAKSASRKKSSRPRSQNNIRPQDPERL